MAVVKRLDEYRHLLMVQKCAPTHSIKSTEMCRINELQAFLYYMYIPMKYSTEALD